MTEAAKIARLWAGFHRLTEDDKDLLVRFTALVRTIPENAFKERSADGLCRFGTQKEAERGELF